MIGRLDIGMKLQQNENTKLKLSFSFYSRVR